MGDGALRGTRLGATSFESDDNVELAPRQIIHYDCPAGHTVSMPFSVEADVPYIWECRCGAEGTIRNGEKPEVKPVKHVRTHWDMLLERRTVEDLEVLLQERLAFVRDGRPSGKRSA